MDIRWSGLAESLASLVILIYNPNATYAASGKQTNTLPIFPGKAYLLAGKSRYGTVEQAGGGGGPIAVSVGWDGKSAWSELDYASKGLTSI